MDVSVLIVSYNVAGYLEQCLASIEEETRCLHEVIIVDNHSSDASADIAARGRPRVHLIRNSENVGFARANNQGFRVAKGRYILMLNPDTVILDGAIDKLLAFMDSDPRIGSCSPKNIGPDHSLQLNCHHFPTVSMTLVEYSGLKRKFPNHRFFGREQMTYWGYDTLREVDWMDGASLMLRRRALEEVGFLDEGYFMYSEECDLCFRLKQKGWKNVFFPHASIIHYGGQSSLAQDREKVHTRTIITYFHQSRHRFFRKHYGRAREICLRGVECLFFSFSYLRNALQRSKKDRQERMEYARIALRLALGLSRSEAGR